MRLRESAPSNAKLRCESDCERIASTLLRLVWACSDVIDIVNTTFAGWGFGGNQLGFPRSGPGGEAPRNKDDKPYLNWRVRIAAPRKAPLRQSNRGPGGRLRK